MAAIFAQLEAMQSRMHESLAIGILIASIEVHEIRAVAAAIKTLADADVKWDTVAERLIEEWRGLKKTMQTGESSSTAKGKKVCDFCSRLGHPADKCWVNPANPNIRLKALRNTGSDSKDKNESDEESPPFVRSGTRRARRRVRIVLRWLALAKRPLGARLS